MLVPKEPCLETPCTETLTFNLPQLTWVFLTHTEDLPLWGSSGKTFQFPLY